MIRVPQNKNKPKKKVRPKRVAIADADKRREQIAKWTLEFIERYRSCLEALAKK